MIQELRSVYDRFVLVDCGDMYFNTRSLPEKRAGLMFEAAAAMGYDAVNVAEGELAFGLKFIEGLYAQFPLPLVSSVIEIPGRKTVIKPYVIKSFDDMTIGITGMTPKAMFKDDIYEKVARNGDSMTSLLRQTLDELNSKVDIIVFLSHFGLEGTKNFLTYNQLTDRISVAVAGHGRYMTNDPVLADNTLIVQSSIGGEYLSVLTLQLDDANRITGHELENIALTSEVPEDDFWLSKMEEFKQEELIQKRKQKKQQELKSVDKEKKDMLQLSPQQFIRMMENEENGTQSQ